MSVAGNTHPVRSYVAGDFFSGPLPIPRVDGADGPLADLMRTRHPEIEIVDLVLEYAVSEPFQEGGRQHEH